VSLASSIFLDLDGVLVRSYSRKDVEEQPHVIKSLPGAVTTYNGVVSVLRPGAREFLEGVKELGNVYLFTAAQLSYAKSLIKAFDLNSYFSKFYTTVYHTQNSIAHELNLTGSPWVIVEDSPITLGITQYKMGSLGITLDDLKNQALVDKHFMTIKTFQPHLFDSGGSLLDYLPQVQEKIHYLEKRLILF
jgi:hypothetical protein